MPDEPQIIELDEDPDAAPRVTAFILIACGLLGVAFLLVNVVFTGEDPYYIQSEWDAGEEPVNTRFDVIPSIVRARDDGAGEDDEAPDPERDEKVRVLKEKEAAKRKPVNPLLEPFQPKGLMPPGQPQQGGMPGSPPSPLQKPRTPSTPGATPAK